MDLKTLIDADRYGPGHKVRTLRDLVLHCAHGLTLTAALEEAWNAGYGAKESEDAWMVYRPKPAPGTLDEAEARHLLARRYPERAAPTRIWMWAADVGGWYIHDDDCLIRPGVNGLVVMEAAGEHAGEVLCNGTSASFPTGTFR